MSIPSPHISRERPEWIRNARYIFLQSGPWTPTQECLNEACDAYDSLIEQLEARDRRDEWLRTQLDNCLDSAMILEQAKPLAIGRALVGDLKDAVNALASGAAVGSGGGAGPGLPGTRHQPPASSPAKERS